MVQDQKALETLDVFFSLNSSSTATTFSDTLGKILLNLHRLGIHVFLLWSNA